VRGTPLAAAVNMAPPCDEEAGEALGCIPRDRTILPFWMEFGATVIEVALGVTTTDAVRLVRAPIERS
jgi:hypothetical protein